MITQGRSLHYLLTVILTLVLAVFLSFPATSDAKSIKIGVRYA